MEQIKFVLERFFYGWRMNAFVFDGQNQILDCCMGTVEKVDMDNEELQREAFDVDGNELFAMIREKVKVAGIPVIHMEENGIYYVSFVEGERLFLFGPASADTLSFAQQVYYRKRHHVTNQKYQVPSIALGRALNGIALLYYTLTGRQVTEKEILEVSGVEVMENPNSSEMLSYEMQNIIEEKQHLSYQDELKWMLQIENGALVKGENRMTPENLEKLERVGTLASEDSLKQFEYMVVSSTVLASRAAIRGGVNAYEAYRLSEMFLQRLSKCTNVMEMLQLHSMVAEEFSRQVRLAKEDRNHDCVERCKDYIAKHRNKNFSLDDVAEAVGKSANYLSRIFSEQTGITMQEYACNARLEAAANMLKYSDESVGEIAEYLNFATQSYFGERFKKRYGVSPANYRKQHRIRDFKEM